VCGNQINDELYAAARPEQSSSSSDPAPAEQTRAVHQRFSSLLFPRGYALAVVVLAAVTILLWFAHGCQDSASTSSSHVSLPAQPAPSFPVGFVDPEIDLGSVPWGADLPLILEFANEGERPVTISTIESNCACALLQEPSSYHGAVVNSREVLPIELEMHTGKRPGEKLAQVEVATVAGTKYVAVIRAYVVGTWHLSADAVHFGKVFLDNPEEVALSVEFSSESERVLGSPECNVPWLICSSESSDERQTRIILVINKEKLSPGMNSGMVTIATTCRTVPTRRIVVTARGVPALVPYPPHLVLLAGTSGVIRFVDESGAPARLDSIDCPSNLLRCRVSEMGSIEVEVPELTNDDNPTTVYVYDTLGRRGQARVSLVFRDKGG
jgi:hypothetical protein